MAEIVIRKTVDDLDNSEDGVATTAFGFEGAQYEIDLSQGNYVKLRSFLDEYLKAARRISGRLTPRKVSIPGVTNATSSGEPEIGRDLDRVASAKEVNGRIRAWYEKQSPQTQASLGVLHPRGAIRRSIRQAYLTAVANGTADDAATDPGTEPEAATEAPELFVEPSARPEPVRTIVAPSGQTETAIIRSWYASQPYHWRATHPLKDHGRIPAEIREAWKDDVADNA